MFSTISSNFSSSYPNGFCASESWEGADNSVVPTIWEAEDVDSTVAAVLVGTGEMVKNLAELEFEASGEGNLEDVCNVVVSTGLAVFEDRISMTAS